MTQAQIVKGPAKAPCVSCPYRLDVPSGVWTAEEYEKLPQYDEDTSYQPVAVFLCHRKDQRVCAGWAGCHDPGELLALRFAGIHPHLPVELAREIAAYESPVPLHPSGSAAADHGLRDVDEPGPEAWALMGKLMQQERRRRNV